MFKMISSPLKLLLTGLYWWLRGPSTIKIEMTDNHLYLKLETTEPNTEYILHVDEISQRVIFSRFYLPDRVRYIYRVTIVRLKEGQPATTWTDYYADLTGIRFLDQQLVLNYVASEHVKRFFDED